MVMFALGITALHAKAGSELCIGRIPEGRCGPIKKITCSYQSGNNLRQEVHFELAENGDFRSIKGPVVLMKVNGSQENTPFTVRKELKGTKIKTHLNHRNPFFVSDIHLSFDQETRIGTLYNDVKGTWVVDHPPVIELRCRF